jgi:ornithine carbamoyltransferase
MHCLPADISGVSCAERRGAGQRCLSATASTYKEAGWKPYIIAAMIMARKYAKPAQVLAQLLSEAQPRVK